MSNWREQLSEESETKAMVAWLHEYYHLPVLFVLVGFVFWNRVRNYGNFIVDGTVYFGGNDPWYHMRMTQYTVQNFPATLPYDPWTYFPIGTAPEQFGTLFDQIIALVALIVGLGSPSESLVRHVFLVIPPVFAVLACIPGYFIGKRLGNRVGGLVVVALIALAPDRMMLVSLAGNTQHEALEVVFMSLSILGVMVALSYAHEEKPVWELVAAREFDAIRGTVVWSMLAGVAMGAYLWTWPPGVWLFGILGIFFVLYLSIEHVRNRSPEHAAFVGVISLGTATVLALSTTRTLAFTEVVARSLLHPFVALLVVVGIVFLAWLSREVDDRGLPTYSYPGIVGASILLSAVAMAVLTPEIFDYFLGQVDRVFGFITPTSRTAGTVGEIQAMEFSQIRETYQLGIFTAGLGGAIILVGQILNDDTSGEGLLVVLWAVLMLIATLTQARFAYYLTVPVGALNAALVGFVISLMGTPDREFNIEAYQVLTVVLVILVVFAPLAGVPMISADTTATEFADQNSAPGDVVAWNDGLQWLNENTPEPGQFGNPDNEPMDLYGSFKETDDFEYPEGSYGVMSWWDYGHWITAQGERIPNANPFQEGPRNAANFLLAQDEGEALNALAEADESEDTKTRFVMIDWRMVEPESGFPIRGKFFAPPEFHNEYEISDFTRRLIQTSDRGGLRTLTRIQKQAYYESMMVRLYHYHGSAHDPAIQQGLGQSQVLVTEWAGQERTFEAPEQIAGQAYVEAPPDGQAVRIFNSMQEARNYVADNPSAQIGGLGAIPEEPVAGLEHFRLVHMTNTSAIPQTVEEARLAQHGVNLNLRLSARRSIQNTGFGSLLQQQIANNTDAPQDQLQSQATNQALNMMFPNTPAFTKTFERVPGATIEGTGPPNQTIRVQVPIEPENGQPFTYTRRVQSDENGNFELTVPYSTTGYDEWGVEEGYAEPTVKATGSYTISTNPTITPNGSFQRWTATVNVTEGQVIGEEPGPVEVELEKEDLQGSVQPGGGDEGGDESGSSDGQSGSDDGNDQSGTDGSGDGEQTGGTEDGSNDEGARNVLGPRGADAVALPVSSN
ncbi:oligosaccharyl transferase, archaeosortase A system-associated [Halobacteriales archaeon QH_2_65_14]|nr:MAG: oligosaccharyl transferase, archaeosortase A system-associated [Halobacteriales archaeon QH_2_65_14]